MMKISALNEESSEESEEEDVPTITKEAQEQIALTEYNRALELLRESKQEDALTIFKELLETELLDEVKKPEVPDGRSRPMLSLKYSCFKNIGAIQASLGNYEGAIENYWEASHLDDSDVTLWHRIGMLAMKTSNLELACSSFKQGLKCNSNHWPCLDSMITALYAVPDYMNCLLYISMALERDRSYVKGLAFRDRIFKDIPCMEECYRLYNSEWHLDPPLYTEYDHVIGDKLIAEAKDVAEKWAETCKVEFTPKPLPELTLRKPIIKCTWYDLGESLLDMHRHIAENNLSFVSRINLVIHKSDDRTNMGQDMEVSGNEVTDSDQDMGQSSIREETEKAMKAESEEMNCGMSDDNQGCGVSDTMMDVEIEDDKKSCSTDVQIIEDEDPLRISDNDGLQFDDQQHQKNELDEQINFEMEENGEKSQQDKVTDDVYNMDNGQNEKLSDKDSEKSNDKAYEKSLEKSDNAESKGDDKFNEKSEGKEEGQRVKKRRRSALCFLQQWAWSCSSMRRSARVRSSNRREAERDDVQLEETLRRIFPSSLLPNTVKLTKDDPSRNMDDSMDTMDLYQLFANQENNSNAMDAMKSSESSKSPSPDTGQRQSYFGTESEAADVEMFINEHSCRSNLMIILARFTELLCTKWNQEWPKGLSEVYLQAHTFMREHIPHPSPFEEHVDDDVLKLDAEMTLLFGELHTDRWLNNKPDILPSSTLDKLGTGMPSEELGHIIFTSVRQDIFNEENIFILLRVLWLKANIFLCQGDTDVVIETLELLLHRLQELEKQDRLVSLQLPNCKSNSQISLKLVERKLRSIQRGQKLGEIQHLYDEKKYSELSCILQDTFKFAKQRNKFLTVSDNIVDRVQQLSMLLDSLWQLQQYEECYVWAEACLNEAWQNYLNASDDAEQKKWTGSILAALEKLEACTIEVSTFVVKYLPESRLSRLVQNLVHIVCHQLDVSETTVEMPLETILPWILLHYILQYEEDKERAKSESSFKNKQHSSHYSESDDEDDGIPASIMILFTAHEFIGRHSWCCYNEAKLLLFTMNLVIPKLETPQFASIKKKLKKYLEQIFYCLYAHCNKSKSRPKQFEEHGAPQMKLTWEGAQLLFDFYKPKQIPELQSPKSASISIDTELLLRRIVQLVPAESNPMKIEEEMNAYIIGDREQMPSVTKPLPHSISTIYYLIGDYQMKNNKWSFAARFYLLDLCLHPSRFNSWFGLALAAGAVIESWLNTYRPVSEDRFLKKAKLVQSSFRHAIALEPGHVVAWTEYGSFVYMFHAFCSRLLKQETDTLSMERFEILENRKEEMLEIADQCFQTSMRLVIQIDDLTPIHDERWLYQYMLGKVAEKKNQDPPIFLGHYAKASEMLYENHAEYPSRISHKSPQNLAVEALEVHYRIHASILKYLEQHEGKPLKKSLGQLFQWHLKNCAEGPFMKYESKLCEKKKDPSFRSEGKSNRKEENGSEGEKTVVTVYQRSNSIEEIEIIDRTNKGQDGTQRIEQMRIGSRKRSPNELSNDNTKRIKLGSVSHLQLMQDVVALIDDLITKVCDIVSEREKVPDDIMVLSSDESNESKSQRKRMETKNLERLKVQMRAEDSKKSPLSNLKIASVFENEGKPGNVQDLMDALMKQAMEISQETRQSSPDDEDTRKFEGKWLQSEDLQLTDKEVKEKGGEKKKATTNSGSKEEVTLSRRGSQESTTTTQTTTTTTETNNSSSSSSDESSSSDDSSDSDSSTESESESAESEPEKKKKEPGFAEKGRYKYKENMSEEEVATLIAYCLAGLEQCILRFSEHYKSFYRLSHFFFNNKTAKDTAKCRDLLLGTYNCQFYPGQNFQGLFAERRSTNFFNGVWHIPNREIDRPGSFASHMSRCVTLLMQVLKETNDSRMLMQLCVQLAKIPDSDKKYLRDSEREQLSRQALTLCLQSLRTKVQSMGSGSVVDSVQHIRTDARTQVLLDVYKIYQQVQKHFQCKEQTVQTFASLLVDTYKTYIGNKNLEGNVLEIAIKCCQRQIMANKIATTNNVTAPSTQPEVASPTPPVVTTQAPVTSTSPQSSQNRKPYKTLTSTGRARGRPPNVNKYLQAMQQGSSIMNQFNSKPNFANYMAGSGNRSLMNPYFMNPFADPNMLSALLASGLGGNMMDPLAAMNYLNQVGSYQDMLRQYQSNLSSLTGLTSALGGAVVSAPTISSVPSMSTATSSINTTPSMSSLGNLNNLTVQQLLSLGNSNPSTSRPAPMYHQATTTKTTTTASITKDRPSISITPVSSSLPHKNKPSKPSPQADPLPVQIPKSLQISQTPKPVLPAPSAQVSLLKPSIVQQVKTSPPKQMTAPQIRVSKSLTEPQPAHNPSLSHSPLKTGGSANPVVVSPVPHPPMGPSLGLKQALPMNIPTSRTGTSLQHKLLSKKNSQRAYPSQTVAQNPARKMKPAKTMPVIPTGFPSLLNPMPGNSSMPQPPYIPPELSGISVSPVNPVNPVNPGAGLKPPGTKYGGYKKQTVKSKPTTMDIAASLPTTFPQSNSAEALSMLSQLQQHSHLEIIPQQKAQIKPTGIDYAKSLSSAVSVVPQKLSDSIRPPNPDCLTVYDIPRAKPSNAAGKKGEKSGNDSVEIITLDD